MTQVVLGLGSNVGNAPENLQRAVALIGELVELERASSLYRSVPMYLLDQASFVNAAVIGQTSKSPRDLLKALKAIEKQMGRVERERNGPREIDIDILVYGHLEYRFECEHELQLQIPHPRLSERRFVLLPLCEIAPNLSIPGLKLPLKLLALTELQSEDVTRIQDEILSIHRPG